MSYGAKMKEDDDWFFGSELRINGRALVREGITLTEDQRSLEAESRTQHTLQRQRSRSSQRSGADLSLECPPAAIRTYFISASHLHGSDWPLRGRWILH